MLRSIRTLAVTAPLVLAACGGGQDRDGTLTVFAAASLTDAFDELGDAYEAANPEVEVTLSYGASSSLREQILSGAPADLFASANRANVEELVDAGVSEEPVDFAANELQVVVPAGNPGGVTGLADLGRDELFIGLCAEEAPCGELARMVLDRAGITPAIDTSEPDVRALLTKVEAGELDAGLVYRTDVLASGSAVEGIDLPFEQNVITTYPIAVLRGAADGDAAVAFVDFVLSAEGAAILASFGFDAP